MTSPLTRVRKPKPPPDYGEFAEYAEQVAADLDAVRNVLETHTYVQSEHAKILEDSERALDLILNKILPAGFEPTSPPATWHNGLVFPYSDREINFTTVQFLVRRAEGWPSADREAVVRARNGYGIASRVFHGAIPNEAMTRVKEARKHFERWELMAYSPAAEDFHEEIAAFRHEDPVIIGRKLVGTAPHYFEIARWDIARDVQLVYERLADNA